MKRAFLFKNLKDIQEFLEGETFRLTYSDFTKEYTLDYLTEDNVQKYGEEYLFFDQTKDRRLTMKYCFETIIGGGFSIKFAPNVLGKILPHNHK